MMFELGDSDHFTSSDELIKLRINSHHAIEVLCMDIKTIDSHPSYDLIFTTEPFASRQKAAEHLYKQMILTNRG